MYDCACSVNMQQVSQLGYSFKCDLSSFDLAQHGLRWDVVKVGSIRSQVEIVGTAWYFGPNDHHHPQFIVVSLPVHISPLCFHNNFFFQKSCVYKTKIFFSECLCFIAEVTLKV